MSKQTDRSRTDGEKIDGRRLPAQQQYALRKRVVRWYRNGRRVMEIVAMSGLSYPTVRRAIDEYAAAGMPAIKPGKRGRRPGEKRALTAAQEHEVRTAIHHERPSHFGMDHVLWNREAVRQLIRSRYGIALSVRAVAIYAERWGLLPPAVGLPGKSDQADWLTQAYPAIRQRARAVAGVIHRAGLLSIDHTDTGGRRKSKVIASQGSNGKLSWLVVGRSLSSRGLIEFFEALVADAETKTFLIFDLPHESLGLRAREWLDEHADELELHWPGGSSQSCVITIERSSVLPAYPSLVGDFA
jgi:transposase